MVPPLVEFGSIALEQPHMAENTLRIENCGPIRSADISFGDLTFFVGPQASGKSIALQWLKLALDRGSIQEDLRRYGLDWGKDPGSFSVLFFGEGMESLAGASSAAQWNNQSVTLSDLAARRAKAGKEVAFFIPAQRVLALRDGWPRPFGDYSPGDPYVVRAFSEQLRWIMEGEFGGNDLLFPKSNRLKKAYRELLRERLFTGFDLKIERVRSRKRLVLGQEGREPLPFMVWSAGQREFIPLLLGLYWLMPPSKVARRRDLKWVVIEEPEMGLHPRAISTVLLLVLELVQRGYRVCISTHSTQVLELAWVLTTLKREQGNPGAILDLLDAPHSSGPMTVARESLKKEVRVYYFEPGKPTADISHLDPDATDLIQANWGGLVECSMRANHIVATAAARGTMAS